MRTVEDILAEERLMTVKDAAVFLAMSPSWVYKRAEDGTLPAVVIGGRTLRFEPAALRAYVERSRAGAAKVVELNTRRQDRKG